MTCTDLTNQNWTVSNSTGLPVAHIFQTILQLTMAESLSLTQAHPHTNAEDYHTTSAHPVGMRKAADEVKTRQW